MKFNLLPICSLVVVLLVATPTAHAQSWSVELNGAKVNDLSGAELGVGYNIETEHFRLTPIVGALLYQGDNDRYYMDTFSNGQERCRDSTNGQFADDANCNNSAAQAYGKLEAAVRFAKTWEAGAGVRVGNETIPYATIGAKFGENGSFKVFGGEDYFGAGLNFRF